VPQGTVEPVPLIDRNDSVLVVVDTQPGFVSASDDERAASETLDRAAWLATTARLLGIPAVVTEEEPEEHGHTVPQLLERLDPDTPTFVKPTFGLAECPDIVAAIRATGRGTAVLMGFESDVCVLQSAIGLHDLGFRAVVVSDASFTQTEGQHEHGLRRLAQAGIELAHCKGIAFEWMRTVDVANATKREGGELAVPPASL
jgi:nicotinamidase-related amidase